MLYLNELNSVPEEYRQYQRLWSAQEIRDRITSKLFRRVDCLGLSYCRQFFALAENETCITRNDQRDVQRDAKTFAVAMGPRRTDPGPDTALLTIHVVALIDNVVKIVCGFVVHISLSFVINKKLCLLIFLEQPREKGRGPGKGFARAIKRTSPSAFRLWTLIARNERPQEVDLRKRCPAMHCREASAYGQRTMMRAGAADLPSPVAQSGPHRVEA